MILRLDMPHTILIYLNFRFNWALPLVHQLCALGKLRLTHMCLPSLPPGFWIPHYNTCYSFPLAAAAPSTNHPTPSHFFFFQSPSMT